MSIERKKEQDAVAEKSRDVAQRRNAETARMDTVREGASVPSACSPEIHGAPARGPVVEWREQKFIARGDDFVLVTAPYRAGCPGRARDVFDVMAEQAARRKGEPVFTEGQVAAARDYRALFEKVQSAGVRGAQFDAEQRTDGRGGSFMDAYLRDAARLRTFYRRIGEGVAKDVIYRTSEGGRALAGAVGSSALGRHRIMVRALVDQVCIGDLAVSEVLRGHGWRPTGKSIKHLREVLCGALERMRGI